jgi:diguanylate cyclase (GGDEF)-like protein/PAS domain S-box-containing protein
MKPDNLPETKQKDSLRQQALNALSNGQIDVKALSKDQQQSIEAILEELRIYHAELELQNQSLRATQIQLENSQQNYLQLFQQLPIAALVVDQHGIIQQVNQQAIQLFTHTKRQHLLNHSIYRLFDADSANWLAQMMMKKNNLISHQQLNLQQVNQLLPVNAYAVHHDHEDYFLQLTIIMLVDMRSEQKLSLTTKVFEHSHEGIMICDAEVKIISVNGSFEKITGYSENEVLGKNPRILSAGKTPLATYKTMWHDLLTLGFWQGELWNRRKNQESFPQQLSISVVRNHQSMITHYVGIFADITARKQAEEQIHQLAFYDLLTGAANRYLLRNQVEKLLTSDTPNTCFTLMFLDLDHFKEINDVFGHDVGDQLLKIVTKRLTEKFHEQETICRLGGDEFVVLLPNKHCDDLAEKTNAVLDCLIQPYHIQGHALKVSASIGVSSYPQHGNTYSELLKFADLAMYHAKSNGRNAYFCFEPWMADNLNKNVTLQMALQQAISRHELHVVFQPQLHSATQSIIGFEVLTRWNHPTLGNISPDVFIPLAEKSDFMIELTDWILTQALDGLSQITTLGYANLRVAVNISAREFKQEELFQRIQQHLAAYPTLSAHQLELELTERMAMLEPDRILHILHALNGLGVRIAIDDFGTGYSSLSYLKKYPIHVLKIDKSFVDDIGKDSDDEAVCQSILALSGALKLETIAEGVETELQAQWLREHGCSSCQGYLIAKPMPLTNLIEWLAERKSQA